MEKHQEQNRKPIRKFVIDFIDPVTRSITDEVIFETTDILGLCSIVDPENKEMHPAAAYELEPYDLEKISTRFGVTLGEGGPVARLRSWRAVDTLPYKVHTNRELALMLSGKKPLAVFSEAYPSCPGLEIIPEAAFDPHITAGLLVKREHVLLEGDRQTRMVLYATPAEAWRIEAYILLKKTALKTGWSEGFEYLEGSLLGYEDWQNDIYIERIFRGQKE